MAARAPFIEASCAGFGQSRSLPMCALCGVLGGKEHWTAAVKREGVYVRGAEPADRRHERRRRVAEANAILGLFGLSLEDWQADSYILRNRTGRSEVVADLAALWPAAEALAGRPLDPLDPEVLDRREAMNA
jgi:hypothetical protein